MKIFQSIIFGAFIGFCATMLHNIYNPYGFIASLLLTYLSIKAIGQTYFYARYQLFAAISWLAVVIVSIAITAVMVITVITFLLSCYS